MPRDVIFVLSCFWFIYGILGLVGIQHIPKKFRNKEWTKQYKFHQGISWLLISIPWLLLYFIDRKMMFLFELKALLIILTAIPSIVYSTVYDRKYIKLLKNEE